MTARIAHTEDVEKALGFVKTALVKAKEVQIDTANEIAKTKVHNEQLKAKAIECMKETKDLQRYSQLLVKIILFCSDFIYIFSVNRYRVACLEVIEWAGSPQFDLPLPRLHDVFQFHILLNARQFIIAKI